MYKPVDLETWNRKEAFEFFKDYEDPFFNVTVNIDATRLHQLCSAYGLSFAAACVFYSQKSVNSIREFRIRLIEGKPVEFERVEATQTVLQDDESFTFCYLGFNEDLKEFCAEAAAAVEDYKAKRTFDVESDRLDLVYYSVIPWISFTSFKHASKLNPDQTIPRIVFGKYVRAEPHILLPVSVEVNHRIVDGIHVGKYVEAFQKNLNECGSDR